jgi:NifU-like protein involved in Fe-S cluster formation
MSQKFITVDINLDGSSKIEAHGFKGKGCADVTKSIEQAISGVKGTKKLKGEYYQAEEKQNANVNV